MNCAKQSTVLVGAVVHQYTCPSVFLFYQFLF